MVTWTPMGSRVGRYCGSEPFSLDQVLTVAFEGRELEWLEPFADVLRRHGGTAGFLADDAPEELAWAREGAEAFLLSLDNALV
jgi:hypothetical protein